MKKFPLHQAIKFYWNAQTIYSAHSPFIFSFMNDVMNNCSEDKDIARIELKRKELLVSESFIPFVEYGAGTVVGNNNDFRKVSEVAKNSLSGPWQCRILYNLVKQFEIRRILEIGTSLGVSTAYLGCASQEGQVITLEGNPSSADIASKIWNDLNINMIDLRIGEFGSTLKSATEELNEIDLAFIDGNHRKSATIEYFNILKSKASTKSIFVVDDIYWSKGMHEAWCEIMMDEEVAFSIDLFRMGIVFFDHSVMPKQHFKLIPFKLKPWSIGLFG